MFIEDEELRGLFKTASEEHLQQLDAGLLHLEKHPEDQACLENLMREAHSLKGDANMLGVREVGALAHEIEHVLGQVRRQEIAFSPELGDRVSEVLEVMGELVREAVTGERASVNPVQALARFLGGGTPPESPPAELPDDEVAAIEEEASADWLPMPEPLPESEGGLRPDMNGGTHASLSPDLSGIAHGTGGANGSAIAPDAPTAVLLPPIATLPPSAPRPANGPTDDYRIKTLRVETRDLDSLMTQAGELTVTKIRIAHRLNDVESLLGFWEDWSRDAFVNRYALGTASAMGDRSQIWQTFQQRTEERIEQMGAAITRLRNALYEDTMRLEGLAEELEAGVRTLRLMPLSSLFSLFPRMVRDLARQESKQVELVLEGGETRADKRILEEMKDPIAHMLRNAIDHGLESPEERQRLGKPAIATITLRGYQTANNILIEVSDDGRGIDPAVIRRAAIAKQLCREEDLDAMTPSQIQALIFEPGFSTRNFVTEVSGRGVGLDVVRTNVDRLKGSIEVLSTPGQGCTIRIRLGTTLATVHVLIVRVAGIDYALPVEFVLRTQLVRPSEIFTIEGREATLLDEYPVPVAHLIDLLELPAQEAKTKAALSTDQPMPCIVLKVGEERLALLVDDLLDEQDVMLKPQSKILRRVRNVAGATILGTGEVCMILSAPDLVKSINRRQRSRSSVAPAPVAQPTRKQVILLVEDSIATRTQEKRILEGAGYEVVTAVNGLDGFSKIMSRSFDAVVSDVQMPKMDGFELAAQIRQNRDFAELPIVLVTTLASDEDKKRGVEVGANAYITKGTFNQEVLLDTLRRLM